ncbi:nuclear transport factor 2 family protein [Spongiimicrobium sp. 3-5]|uniref:nuclear transport factor 2 family protein n=1 Tax=Spongiimicrobium sp. 3-5 TaxID=3332596 RepID=UPI00398141C9
MFLPEINARKTAARFLMVLILCSISCKKKEGEHKHDTSIMSDSLSLVQMIAIREKAMIKRDIKLAMDQFADNATWINSQGYYFEGKEHVANFHNMLIGNDSLDYYYEAGEPRVRILDNRNALAYYSWKMFWYKREKPADTTFREIGLMTLTAHKTNKDWEWVAVTNQHTPWFYDSITPVTVD